MSLSAWQPRNGGCLRGRGRSGRCHPLTRAGLAAAQHEPGDQRSSALMPLAVLPILHRGVVDSCHWLLIRRCIDDPHEKAYYLVFAPPHTSLQEMVQAIGKRWHIEQDLQATKGLGLDHYEVRSFSGWYRHVTLVLLAYAFLVGLCVHDTSHLPTTCQHGQPSPREPLMPLTASEVRHLLARLIWPAPSHATLVRAWSNWRRSHAYWASHFHTRRRLDSG